MNIRQSPSKLPPANPLYTKPLFSQQPKPIFKFQFVKNQTSYQGGNSLLDISKSSDYLIDTGKKRILRGLKNEGDGQSNNYYQKFDNRNMNVLKGVEYVSGLFLPKSVILQNTKKINNAQGLIRQLGVTSRSQFPTLEVNCVGSGITFQSNIESGNLFSVFQSSATSFDLTLQNDVNSKGNTQWFYFQVSNLPKDTEMTFNIVNLLKSDSLFNYGMQPVVFSKLKSKLTGEGWKREGKSISYSKSDYKREGETKKKYYQLSFKITSKIYGDTLQIAHCFPYTYSMVQDHISSIQKHPTKKMYFTHQILAKTPTKHSIDVLTITNPKTQKIEEDNRKIILIMARQHPGETQSSYVCEGLINFLLLKTEASHFLREHYIFKVIPLINPDGVIFGNYRTNLLGVDLNRKWDTADDELAPEVTAIKNYIKKLNGTNNRIRMIIDLHGHSRKLGSFFYGNPNQESPEETRLLPYIYSKLSKQVSFNDCTFAISSDKLTSARVFLHQKLQIKSVYTYQVSFYGYRKEGKIVHFGVEDYKKLGVNLCEALYNILESEVDFEIVNKFKIQLKTNSELLRIGEDDRSGSDSKPDQCQLLKQDFDELNGEGNHNISKALNLDQLLNEDEPFSNSKKIEDDPLQLNIQSAENSTRDCYNKMRKKIKSILPMNQINSKPFHRYELGLEPSVTPNIKIKMTQKINRSLKEICSEINKIQASTQTSERPEQNCAQQYQPLFQVRRNNKSLSTTSAAARRTLVLKLDVTPKLSFFLPNPNTKYVNVSTQTHTSNLLGYSPSMIKQSSTQLLGKSSHKLSSILHPIRGTIMQRMSVDERSTDMIRRRNLRPIVEKVKFEKRVQDVEKLLDVKKKQLFDNNSKSMTRK